MSEALAPARNDGRTFILCLLAALAEGYDLQSAGALAPRFAPALMLNPGQVGWVFTTNIIGLLIGAALGGWVADRLGRKRVLIASMVVFGLFTLGTAIAADYPFLVSMRFLTGLGLGGALPNVIALVAESSRPESRASRVTLLSAAIPAGGLIAVSVVLFGPTGLSWRTVFALGGWAPLALAPLIAFMLRESGSFMRAKAERQAKGAEAPRRNVPAALFGQGRALPTTLLWASFIFITIVLYMLINWLPSLIVAKGFSVREASLANFAFATGSVVGAVALGVLTRRVDLRLLFFVTYVATALGLVGLTAVGADLTLAVIASGVAGCFVIGGQFMLYGIAPTIYPYQVRATGVGAAVAFGRVGAVIGPAAGGIILSRGGTPADVLLAGLPAVAISLAAALVLIWKPRAPTD